MSKETLNAAARLCLLLAYSNCRAVPAFIFVRPYYATRRWTAGGAIELQDSEVGLTWPLELFQRLGPDVLLESVPSTSYSLIYFGVNITALTGPATHLKYSLVLSTDVQKVKDAQTLNIFVQDCWLMLSLSESARADIRKNSTETDYVDVLQDFTKLVACSMPDLYAEGLWKSLYMTLRPIIEHDLVPFLSVLEERDLSGKVFSEHGSTHEILRCLAFHSFAEGLALNAGLPFSARERANIETRYKSTDEVAKHPFLAIEFKNWLCSRIMEQVEQRGSRQQSLENHRPVLPHTGLMPLYIKLATLSLFRATSDTVCRRLAIEISGEPLLRPHIQDSMLDAILRGLISSSDKNDIAIGERGLDVGARLALAFALSEDGFYERGLRLLLLSLKELEINGLCASFEYGLASAELVKCHNAMGLERAGLIYGLQALSLHRSVSNELVRYDILCLKIAMVDSYIGSAAYGKAEEALNEILSTIPFKRFGSILCLTTLRLSKVLRRRGNVQTLNVAVQSPIEIAVRAVGDASKETQAECVDELASTIIHIQSSGVKIEVEYLEELGTELLAQIPPSELPGMKQRLEELQVTIQRHEDMSAVFEQFGTEDAFQVAQETHAGASSPRDVPVEPPRWEDFRDTSLTDSPREDNPFRRSDPVISAGGLPVSRNEDPSRYGLLGAADPDFARPTTRPGLFGPVSQRVTSTTPNLRVTVIAADGLYKRSLFRFPSPFAVTTIDGAQTRTTSVIDNTLNPYWNEAFDLRVTEGSIMTTQIFDQKKLKKKDQGFLGVINLRIGDVVDVDIGGDEMLTRDLKKFTDNLVVRGKLIIQLSTTPWMPIFRS